MRQLVPVIFLLLSASAHGSPASQQVGAIPTKDASYYPYIRSMSSGPNESANLSAAEYEDQPGEVPRGRFFRVAVFSSEIYSSAYIEEVVFGFEGCCQRLGGIWKCDLEDLYDKFQMKGELVGFEVVRWDSPRSFVFKLKGDQFRASGIGKNMLKVERYAGG